MKPKINAIIMASGLSKRMGKNKLLININEKTMIQHALDRLCIDDFYHCFVVTPYEEVKELAKGYASKIKYLEIIHNSEYEKGQSASVILGSKASATDQAAMMFFSGDMPYLKDNTIKKMIKTFYEINQIIVPRYGGQPGLPVIFPYKYINELLNLSGDQGGRSIIFRYPNDVYYLDIENMMEGQDIDSKEDLLSEIRTEEVIK